MGAKVIVLLGLFLAVTLLVCSEVAASRELTETTNVVDPSTEVYQYEGGGGDVPGSSTGHSSTGHSPKGGRCRHGCCGKSHNGCKCCTHAGENMEAGTQN